MNWVKEYVGINVIQINIGFRLGQKTKKKNIWKCVGSAMWRGSSRMRWANVPPFTFQSSALLIKLIGDVKNGFANTNQWRRKYTIDPKHKWAQRRRASFPLCHRSIYTQIRRVGRCGRRRSLFDNLRHFELVFCFMVISALIICWRNLNTSFSFCFCLLQCVSGNR